MIYYTEDITRLSVAIMLLVIWSVRRVERANLIWAIGYLVIGLGALMAQQGEPDLARRIVMVVCASAASLLIWVGAEIFLHRHPRRGLTVLTGVVGVALLLVCALRSATLLVPALAVPVVLATGYAAYAVGSYGRVFRATAATTFVTALLLFIHDAILPGNPVLQGLLALAYVLLALAIAHVTFRQFQTRLMSVINTDAVTGLANRAAFLEGIQALLHATEQDPVHIAVLCIDIENFRAVNEAIGTRSGNRVLCEVGSRLRHAAQRVYMVARDEGDRFLLLLSGTSAGTVTRNAEDTASQIERAITRPFQIGETSLTLRVRIGVDLVCGADADVETLVQHAAVASGRQRAGVSAGLQFYNARMNQTALRKLDLERGLRDALSNGELHLAYQPIVDVESGEVIAAEALLRWTSPTLGVVAPTEMIPVAEESGLIVEIGEWVIRQAAAQVMRWQEQGRSIPVSVNVSAHQLARRDFCRRVVEILRAAGVAPSLLDLELTESVFLGDDAAVIGNVNALHDAGVRLSLDDFGTGFSSLSYLTRLPLATIKIDQTFVHQLHRDERSRRVTEIICAIGQQLDLALTAEGVETLEQIKLLRSFGVRRMQGFYFAVPSSAADLILSASGLADESASAA